MTKITKFQQERELHNFTRILDEAKKIISRNIEVHTVLQKLCELLKSNISYYDWVGFYLVDKETPRELALGPFVGEPTTHIRIPFGKGICGQAAEKEETFVIQDVSKETNYLSCSIKVQSEIVVPLFDKKGKIVGELDIDSHTPSVFTKEDEVFLKKICGQLSVLF